MLLKVLIKDSTDEEGYEGVDSEESNTMLWESCWLPILHTLAEGAADTRLLVRESVVDALVKAVSDRHSFAVPTGVLVQVLTTIYIPLVTFLNECVKKEAESSGTSSSTSAASAAGGNVVAPVAVNTTPPVGSVSSAVAAGAALREASHHVLQENWVKIEVQDDAASLDSNNSVVARSNGLLNAGSIFEKSLSGLCSTFLRNIDKLRNFPAFDKLWLNLLDLFGTILKKNLPAAPAGGDDATAVTTAAAAAKAEEGPQKVDFASVKLLDVLTVLLQEGIFVHRESLWKITLEMIQQFRCSALGDLSLGGPMGGVTSNAGSAVSK